MTDENRDQDLKEMPLLVYIAREKRPGHPHHFKGGALNILVNSLYTSDNLFYCSKIIHCYTLEFSFSNFLACKVLDNYFVDLIYTQGFMVTL